MNIHWTNFKGSLQNLLHFEAIYSVEWWSLFYSVSGFFFNKLFILVRTPIKVLVLTIGPKSTILLTFKKSRTS